MEPEATIEYAIASCWQTRLLSLHFVPREGDPNWLTRKRNGWTIYAHWNHLSVMFEVARTKCVPMMEGMCFARPRDAYTLAERIIAYVATEPYYDIPADLIRLETELRDAPRA